MDDMLKYRLCVWPNKGVLETSDSPMFSAEMYDIESHEVIAQVADFVDLDPDEIDVSGDYSTIEWKGLPVMEFYYYVNDEEIVGYYLIVCFAQ